MPLKHFGASPLPQQSAEIALFAELCNFRSHLVDVEIRDHKAGIILDKLRHTACTCKAEDWLSQGSSFQTDKRTWVNAGSKGQHIETVVIICQIRHRRDKGNIVDAGFFNIITKLPTRLNTDPDKMNLVLRVPAGGHNSHLYEKVRTFPPIGCTDCTDHQCFRPDSQPLSQHLF